MNNRILLLLIFAILLLGGGIYIFLPSTQANVMIQHLHYNDGRALLALQWLVKHRGVAAFDLVYTHGSPYIQHEMPYIIQDHETVMQLGRKLTAKETLNILLQGLHVANMDANFNAAIALHQTQAKQPLFTAQNINLLFPLLNKQLTSNPNLSPLWQILEETPDHAMLDVVPDTIFLQGISGRYPNQAMPALCHKYETRKVRWIYGTSGTINLPNTLLLALMQSPSLDIQINACEQLTNNYAAVATNKYAIYASNNSLVP